MLEDFIEVNELKAELIKLEKPAYSLKNALKELKCSFSEFISVKPFLDSIQEPFLIIFLASDKLDETKAKKLVNVKFFLEASPNEALEITGYEEGLIPPVSVYGIKTIMDKKIEGKEFVFSPAGKENLFLKISPKEIIESNEGMIVAEIVK
ncbi:MAG: YbaK/EbsC family protein [archaeon]